ncbi:unnamed protein product [Mytilus coruscus]|uniref:Uncharacterized protein n=1 Tax=Mytilus coruscus TaxID=42192 RepID=A0A6J8C321_MYTCO|nr:unnamed protein product [Mytilus coruscus]
MMQRSLVIVIFIALTAEAQQSDNVCDQPKVVGPCNARMKRFYYDVHSGMCGEFYYGGCDGNENNFKTIEECKTVCNRRVCTLPQFGGPGGVTIQRWFYNADAMQCESFIYDGWNGNMNNFRTKTECEVLCNGVKKDPCGPLPPCAPPPFGTCSGFTYNIINGMKCITGCTYQRCKQGSCPKDPQVTCASNCMLDEECNGKKMCCSGCCRDPAPVLDPKPGKCPNDPSQLTVQRPCYLRKSECERDTQCDGKRKCCRFSCRNFCVDPDK